MNPWDPNTQGRGEGTYSQPTSTQPNFGERLYSARPNMPNEGGYTPGGNNTNTGGGTHYGDTGGFIPNGWQTTMPNPWQTYNQGQGQGQGGGANFGQPLYPWLMPYGGNFTAPMSQGSQNALNQYGQFVGGGQGLQPGSNYINDVLSGKYLNFASNPWLQQIQSGLQGSKQYQDQQAIDRIKSGMAAGGNAVSGASAGAQADYLGQSNNAFNTLIGNLMNQNYGMERGFMNQAPGQLAGLAGQQGAGFGQLFNMSDEPRQIQQSDYDRQYQDFLRQTGGMQGAFQYPDLLTQQLLYGGGFHGQYPNQFGSSLGDLLGQMAGQNNWGGTLMDFLGGLFGNGGGGSSDGIELGHDAGTPSGVAGPVGYGDTGWYNQALTNAQNQFATTQANQKKPPPGSGTAALVALIMNLLGGGHRQTTGQRPSQSGGGGQSPASAAGKGLSDLVKSIFGGGGGPKASNPYAQPIGPNNMGPYQDFLSQEFGGSPASEYGMNQYQNPELGWEQLLNNEFGGGGDTGGYNPTNFGSPTDFTGTGTQDFSLGLDPSMFAGMDTGGGGSDFSLGDTSLGSFD